MRSDLSPDKKIKDILDSLKDVFSHNIYKENPHECISVLLDRAKELLESQLSKDPASQHVIHENILKLHQHFLLTMDNYLLVLQNVNINKSSEARLQHAVLGDLNQTSTQLRWGYASHAVEREIARMLMSDSPNLVKIFEHARASRAMIVMMEKNKLVDNFGLLRESNIRDAYSFDDGASPAFNLKKVFPNLLEHLNHQLEKIHFSEPGGDESYRLDDERESIYRICSSVGEPFSSQELKLHYEGMGELRRCMKIESAFYSQSNITDIQNQYLTPILEKLKTRSDTHESYSPQDFLFDLGQLMYFLVKAYPLRRGSAAVIQWIARALCEVYSAPQSVFIGDIKLGSDGLTPYDIYAQFTFDVVDYAKAVQKALLPQFLQRRQYSETRVQRDGEYTLTDTSALAVVRQHAGIALTNQLAPQKRYQDEAHQSVANLVKSLDLNTTLGYRLFSDVFNCSLRFKGFYNPNNLLRKLAEEIEKGSQLASKNDWCLFYIAHMKHRLKKHPYDVTPDVIKDDVKWLGMNDSDIKLKDEILEAYKSELSPQVTPHSMFSGTVSDMIPYSPSPGVSSPKDKPR